LIVVTVRVAVREAIVAHAREAAPDECCGVLFGREGVVVEAVRTRNVARSPRTRYEIDPGDHIDARRDARRRGLAIVGFYHSHPGGGAAPSPTDLADATYPGHLYVIVGLGIGEPDVRVFEFDHGNFREQGLVTVG
jgi:proteasome lid subunit RPN8/RPN11